jgi:transposase
VLVEAARMSKKIWIGVDVGADTMSVCAINDAGNPVFEMHLPTSAAALDAALKPIRRSNIDVIGVEAGSSSIHLARGLLRLKYPVVVFECRQVSAYLGLRGNKTDKNDARCIAEVARSGRETVSHVAIKSPECQNIRSMLTMRQQFVRMRIAGEAGMRSLFRLNGGKLVSCRTAADLRKEVSLELD